MKMESDGGGLVISDEQMRSGRGARLWLPLACWLSQLGQSEQSVTSCLQAYERLGSAHERNADLLMSIAFFEKQAALAQGDPNIQRATTHLREV